MSAAIKLHLNNNDYLDSVGFNEGNYRFVFGILHFNDCGSFNILVLFGKHNTSFPVINRGEEDAGMDSRRSLSLVSISVSRDELLGNILAGIGFSISLPGIAGDGALSTG